MRSLKVEKSRMALCGEVSGAALKNNQYISKRRALDTSHVSPKSNRPTHRKGSRPDATTPGRRPFVSLAGFYYALW